MSKGPASQVVSCPQCGAENELRNPGIITLVCGSCQTTIYREGAALRAGKQASLIPSSSGLAVSSKGRVAGDMVEIVGRIRFEHDQGGWDEWYCEDTDGNPVWLVEDEGRFVLERAVKTPLPDGMDAASLGEQFEVDGQRFQVVESGDGRVRGGEGQLPRNFVPDEPFRFIDLAAIDGEERLTLEVSSGVVEAFVGSVISRSELDFAALRVTEKLREQGRAQACAGCGAPLPIIALPEPVQTISCTRCGAMYGYKKQKLAQIASQEPRDDMHLEVGDVGSFFGDQWEVVGRMVYEEFELDDGRWTELPTLCHEYLVRSSTDELATLEIADEGIVLVRKLSVPPPVDEMVHLPWGHSIAHASKKYRMYERGRSELVYVDGALPWKARKGDSSGFVDCIDRPGALSDYAATRLSIEWPGGKTAPKKDGEVEGFLGSHVSVDVFTKAFPDRPRPDISTEILRPNKVSVGTFNFGCLTTIVSVFAMVVALIMASGWGETLASVEVKAEKFPAEGISEPFEITDDIGLIGVQIDTDLDNNWTYVEYDFVNVSTQESIAFVPAEVSYYYGYEDGESWTEGSASTSRTFVAPPPGTYQLSLAVDEGERPVQVVAYVFEKSFDDRWPIRMGFVLIGFGLIQVVRRLTGAPNLWPSED